MILSALCHKWGCDKTDVREPTGVLLVKRRDGNVKLRNIPIRDKILTANKFPVTKFVTTCVEAD